MTMSLESTELQRLKELTIVDAVARIITSTLDIQDVYAEFAQQLRLLVEFDCVAIAVIDHDAGAMEHKYAYGEPQNVYQIGKILTIDHSRTQRMLMTGRSFVTDDVSGDGRFPRDEWLLETGLRASMNTPLVYMGKIFGALNLRSKKAAAFGLEEQAIIERLANLNAPAVRNADLYERSKRIEIELRQREDESQVLADIGRIISSSLDINHVYELLGDEIRKIIPFDRMTLSMLDHESYSVSRTWKLGTEVSQRPPGERLQLAGTISEKIIHKRSAMIFEADSEQDLAQRMPGLLRSYHAGMRSFLAVPLIYRDDVIAALILRSKERDAYRQPHWDFIERIGNQISGAVANSRLYAERVRA